MSFIKGRDTMLISFLVLKSSPCAHAAADRYSELLGFGLLNRNRCTVCNRLQMQLEVLGLVYYRKNMWNISDFWDKNRANSNGDNRIWAVPVLSLCMEEGL